MIYLRSHYVSTVIIMLFTVHPDVATMMFSGFACYEIESEETWLLEDLDIRCWQGDHTVYALSVALPGLVIWAFGIPLFALGLLIHYRKRLNEIYIRKKLGFIFMGYKRETFYWEVVITYRKLSIAFISVFLYILSVNV